ncbi:hypothetical protein PIB30_029873 [Stylosanthes scabra]|uniref:Uncharacterized protein n=1 Tax=Stylosanthes scabra TaxID=79078 RepID=A0ABU6Z890_9FABA|nr:hypothetical protein [Stylosanthes scabra]
MAPVHGPHRQSWGIQLGFYCSCLAIQESMPSMYQERGSSGGTTATPAELDILVISYTQIARIRRLTCLSVGIQFVWLPYRSYLVEVVVHLSIWHPDHWVVWTSIVPLIYFRAIEWHQMDRMILQFGGVQNIPHAPLNIDFQHAKYGRGIDRWYPTTYQCWHGLWATRFSQTFEVAHEDDQGPSADFL